jgi:hypothetical protein
LARIEGHGDRSRPAAATSWRTQTIETIAAVVMLVALLGLAVALTFIAGR